MSRFTKENKFSNPRKNIIPLGVKNGLNLNYTLPSGEAYIAGTLEVFLGGGKLCGNQDDLDRDYEENPNGQEFTIRIEPSLAHRLNKAPLCRECLEINYFRKKKCT